MRYNYEELSPDQFEDLVILICKELLGTGVQGFSPGPDGGRDARFNGSAQNYPSSTRPWDGTIVIQAKHTKDIGKSFSDKSFYSPTSRSCTVAKEIPKVARLKSRGHLDFYMLFSNRKLSAGAHDEICAAIAQGADIPETSICLCGIEELDRYLAAYKHIPKSIGMNSIYSPLVVNSEDIATVIEAFVHRRKDLDSIAPSKPVPRVSLEEKNRVNKMSADYSNELNRRYLKLTTQIERFLAAPENQELTEAYEAATAEFQFKIIDYRNDNEDETFDFVMNNLFDVLCAKEPILQEPKHKNLTRALLYYMYWNCDIGKREEGNAQAN